MSNDGERAPFFEQLSPGDCFRWETSYTTGQGGQYKTHHHWIYTQFVGIDARKRVTWSYWDQRDFYEEEWKPSAIPDRLEVFDPTPTPEQLATRLYSEQQENRYVPTPWTLGELQDTTWINRHTHTIVGGGAIDLDRWGRVQLFHTTGVRIGRMMETLTIWRNLPDGTPILAVEHWDRFDAMDKEEQARRAALQVAALMRRLETYDGKPPVWLTREIADARQLYETLSSGRLVPFNLLNTGAKAGQQLALF